MIRVAPPPTTSQGIRFGMREEMWEILAMGKLSAAAVRATSRPGRIGDGDGLFLVVQPGETKS